MSQGKRIVVIDDDPDFIEFARIVLESASYEVLSASDAEDGLALIHSQPPDLILTDVLMSYSLEGVSVTREVRADPQLSKIPVIVISAIARSPDADIFPEGAEPATDGFLTKPVSPATLLAAVQTCLNSDSACRLI
jgi:CheY-like chemotaxis protein